MKKCLQAYKAFWKSMSYWGQKIFIVLHSIICNTIEEYFSLFSFKEQFLFFFFENIIVKLFNTKKKKWKTKRKWFSISTFFHFPYKRQESKKETKNTKSKKKVYYSLLIDMHVYEVGKHDCAYLIVDYSPLASIKRQTVIFLIKKYYVIMTLEKKKKKKGKIWWKKMEKS